MEKNENKINIEKPEETEEIKKVKNKIKLIFLNSFITEQISEQENNKQKELKDIITINTNETTKEETSKEEKSSNEIITKKKQKFENIKL